MTPAKAAELLLHRRNARASLAYFAAAVPVPGSPVVGSDERFGLIETQQAPHHVVILHEMQHCAQTPHGRLMIMAPPGSAKSTYASVVTPAWYLGTRDNARVILASYGDDLARRHGRRTRQLLAERETMAILQTQLQADSRAAEEFALSNGSEYIACGIQAGVTGNRAHGLIIDDPVRGREQADSKLIRDKTWESYQDNLLTRLIPGGWVVLILTRWHEDDLAGRILPHDWSGESGDIACRDGNTWRVLCFQAEAQHISDPMHRCAGAMLWPEWFTDRHWSQFRLDRRTWSSLYQQLPSPAEGIHFRSDDFAYYDKLPANLRVIGGSDYAVTPDCGDWTEHGVAGVADDGTLYILDWWRGQTGPETWIERKIDMIVRHKPLCWYGEAGPIRRAIEGLLRNRMIEREVNCRIEWLASVSDKLTRAQPIIALSGMGRVLYPRAAWVAELQRQCLVFPAGHPDDGVDALSIIGRGTVLLGTKRIRRTSVPHTRYNPQINTGGWLGA